MIVEHFTGSFTAGRNGLPPEKGGLGAQVDCGGLLEAGSALGDQWVRQIFEQPPLSDCHFSLLPRNRVDRTAAIDARGPGGCDLRVSIGSDLHLKAQIVFIEDPARYVVQVRECLSTGVGECANYPPRGLLMLQPKHGLAG